MNNVQRYTDFSATELDEAAAWLRDLPKGDWMARHKILDDGWVSINTKGMPAVVRQMVKDQFAAIELMTPEEVRRYVAADSPEEKVQLVDEVLDRASR